SDGNAAATDAAAAAGGGANNGTIFDDINTTTCCSGIIHACRSHSHSHFGGESHTFAWIANVNDAKSSSAVVEYLQTLGYKKSSMKFIPYSSHQQWIARYPHAIPIVECDMDGKLRVHAHSSAGASTTTTSTTSHEMRSASDLMNKQSKKRKVANNKKSKSKPSPKLLSNGCLPNMERDELHIMIHQYFTWLHDELVTMETHATGRRLVSNAGVSVPALRSLVSKLEGAFRAVQQHQQQSILKVNDGGSGGSGGGGGEGSSGGVGVMSEDGRRRTSGITVPTNGGGINGVMDYHSNPSLPFLEQALQLELQRKVLDKFALDSSSSALATSDNTAAAAGEGRDESSPDEDENKLQHWRSLDFDTLYQKLVEFKEDTGHASPPMKHIELGRWVAELRSNKKRLRDRGLEFELPKHAEETETENHDDDDDTMMMPVSVDAVSAGETRGETSMHPPSLPSTKPCTTPPNTHLTQSCVQLLDAISFPWTILPARVTWEQRLEELKQFRELEGRFPTNKEGALGNWLKGQRKLYTKNDADFMMNKRPKLEEIGVPLRQRPYSALSWDDRFQQLVEFGRVNRHFNVPNPIPENADGREMIVDPSSDVADAKRFYKFVVKLNTDYRNLQRGIPSTILTEERINQLINIGFEFSTKPAQKAVPELDWNTRIQQLEAFQSEMGHLKVDPNYDKYSNIGGWAVEMSERYKSWQEGREYLSQDMVDKFNQLSAMGFGFDVFPSGRGNRSWEESFDLLLQYRQETGSTRVPHHYKADFRLGSWVAVQRKEYKLLMEGRPSRITQERIQRLESVGFEWVARRG
ncbi:hypothetical protein ACHAXH_007609, partial [Discostella pseudostelligera]